MTLNSLFSCLYPSSRFSVVDQDTPISQGILIKCFRSWSFSRVLISLVFRPFFILFMCILVTSQGPFESTVANFLGILKYPMIYTSLKNLDKMMYFQDGLRKHETIQGTQIRVNLSVRVLADFRTVLRNSGKLINSLLVKCEPEWEDKNTFLT